MVSEEYKAAMAHRGKRHVLIMVSFLCIMNSEPLGLRLKLGCDWLASPVPEHAHSTNDIHTERKEGCEGW